MKTYIITSILSVATIFGCVAFAQDADELLQVEARGGVTDLLDEIAARDKTIADREQAIVKLEAAFEEINEAFSKKVAEVKSITSSDALDSALDAKKKSLDQRDAALSARDEALAKRDEVQKEFDELTLSSSDKIRILEESLGEKQDSLDKVQKAIEFKDSEIARLQVQVEEAQESTHKEKLALTYNLGCIYKASQKYSKAETAFLKALEISPDDSSVHYNLGILYDDNLDKDDKARYHYERFIELDPSDSDVPNVRKWIKEL